MSDLSNLRTLITTIIVINIFISFISTICHHSHCSQGFGEKLALVAASMVWGRAGQRQRKGGTSRPSQASWSTAPSWTSAGQPWSGGTAQAWHEARPTGSSSCWWTISTPADPSARLVWTPWSCRGRTRRQWATLRLSLMFTWTAATSRDGTTGATWAIEWAARPALSASATPR